MLFLILIGVALLAAGYILYRHRDSAKTAADKIGSVAAAAKDAFKGKP
jgi:hypothetical protein